MTQSKKGRARPSDVVLGKNLRKIRRAAGMTQPELAELCEVTFQQVQKYENGKNRISTSKLLMISNALNVELEDFLDGLIKKDSSRFTLQDLDKKTLKLLMILQDLDDPEIVESLLSIVSRIPKT